MSPSAQEGIRSLERDAIESNLHFHAPICTVATSEIKFLPSDAPNASAQANVAVHLDLANKTLRVLEGSKSFHGPSMVTSETGNTWQDCRITKTYMKILKHPKFGFRSFTSIPFSMDHF